MRPMLFTLAAMTFLGLSTIARAEDGPTEIAVAKLPKKLAAILEVKYPAAQLVAAYKDVDDDETFYSIALTYKKHEYEVTITSHGEIVETTKALTAKDLPDVVQKTLQAKHKNAKVKSATEVREVAQKIQRSFHVEVEAGSAVIEIVFDVQGKILSEENVTNATERKK